MLEKVLTNHRLAGVAPEVNLGFHGAQVMKPDIYLGFEIQGICKQAFETGAPASLQRRIGAFKMFSKIIKLSNKGC